MLERMARPLRGLSNGIASVMDAHLSAARRPRQLLQDFLNGSWLGHSLHAVLVDVVIGAATAALLLDILRVFFSVDGLETPPPGSSASPICPPSGPSSPA